MMNMLSGKGKFGGKGFDASGGETGADGEGSADTSELNPKSFFIFFTSLSPNLKLYRHFLLNRRQFLIISNIFACKVRCWKQLRRPRGAHRLPEGRQRQRGQREGEGQRQVRHKLFFFSFCFKIYIKNHKH